MTEPRNTEGLTPAQTVGPFFAIGLSWAAGAQAAVSSGAIWVRGRVLDGAGEPVPDAIIETWQSDPPVSETFRGFTRCPTDQEGRYAIRTLKPAMVPGPHGRPQAPHLAVSVFARGLLHRVVTRIYFADEAVANTADPVLTAAGDGGASMIATVAADGYRLDIHLQGPDETTFLDI